MLRHFAYALAACAVALPAVAQESGQPAPAAATSPTAPADTKPARSPSDPISSDDLTNHYAAGLQLHYLNVPGFMLSPFLQSYTTLSSYGFGGYFIRRNGSLDIVLSVDFGFYSPPDGNYLGANKDPSLDTHFTHFDSLNFLSVDIGFFYVHDLTSWLAITVGGGVGVGLVLGNIYVINNSGPQDGGGCGPSTVTDPQKCYPNNVGPIDPKNPPFDKLNATTNQGGTDTSATPRYHASSDKPPVMVVVNFQLGFKIKLHRHFGVNITGGFRDGFVVGGGPEFVF